MIKRKTITALDFLAMINCEGPQNKMASNDEAITVSEPVVFDAGDYDSIGRYGLSIQNVVFDGTVLVRGKFKLNAYIRFANCIFNEGLNFDELTCRLLELDDVNVRSDLTLSASTLFGQVSITGAMLEGVDLNGTISKKCDATYGESATFAQPSSGNLKFEPETFDSVELGDRFSIDRALTSSQTFAYQLHLAGTPVIVSHETAQRML